MRKGDIILVTSNFFSFKNRNNLTYTMSLKPELQLQTIERDTETLQSQILINTYENFPDTNFT